jgi:hypothetical protein
VEGIEEESKKEAKEAKSTPACKVTVRSHAKTAA